MTSPIATKTTRRAALDAALKIDGWLTGREAGTLYDLAREADGPIVEIGSFYGRSTAAIALGSMAGRGQPVYAVDPFVGPQDRARPTSLKNTMGPPPCPELLRANLDGAGVNGLVRIVPKKSADALEQVPSECSVIFIDGAHDYEAVATDLRNYLPKIKPNGTVILHDATSCDPGVVKAIDEILMPDGENWRPVGRVDSAVMFKRGKIQPRNILLGVPGRNFEYGVMQALMDCSRVHQVLPRNNANGWDDFNVLWAQALNAFEAGEVTHFAMLHSDVIPASLWLDTLISELEDKQADLVSTVIPIKDMRGLVSTGIGSPNHIHGAFRRFTMAEILDMPATFSIDDTPYGGGDKYLLHNTGCWVCDLRSPLFSQADESGHARCWFDFPTRVYRNADGKWTNDRESEDWNFSRKIAALGAKTFATRKLPVVHRGHCDYSNTDHWGEWDYDKDTAGNWKAK